MQTFPLQSSSIPALVILILTKIVLAIIIGYLTMYLYKLFFKKPTLKIIELKETDETILENEHDSNHDDHDHNDEHGSHDHENEDHDEHEEHTEHHVHACCHHDLEDAKFDWKHPLIHCLKITLYIFIINILLEGLIAIVGESNLERFLN